MRQFRNYDTKIDWSNCTLIFLIFNVRYMFLLLTLAQKRWHTHAGAHTQEYKACTVVASTFLYLEHTTDGEKGEMQANYRVALRIIFMALRVCTSFQVPAPVAITGCSSFKILRLAILRHATATTSIKLCTWHHSSYCFEKGEQCNFKMSTRALNPPFRY